MQEREMYLFLCSIYRISQEEIDILKAQFGKLEVLMYLDEKEILKNKNLNSKLLKNIVKYRSHSRIENIKGVLEEKDIQYVCFSDDDYPESLKHIQMPPPILFYKGDISILAKDCLLIGTMINKGIINIMVKNIINKVID